MAGRRAVERRLGWRPEPTRQIAKSNTYPREFPRRFKGRLRKGLAEIERKK